MSIITTNKFMWKLNSMLKAVFSRSAIPTQSELKNIRALLHLVGDDQAQSGSQYNALPPVEIRPSSAINGGRGLFTTRAIKNGEILSFYAGVLFPQPPLQVQNDGSLMANSVAIIPQSKTNAYIVNLAESGAGFLDGDVQGDGEVNAVMAAQLVNHPPRGVPTNVSLVEFFYEDLYTPEMSAKEKYSLLHLAHKVNVLFQGPWYISDMGEVKHTPRCPDLVAAADVGEVEEAKASRDQDYWKLLAGAAMVATRDIEKDEELWFDYELSCEDLPSEMKEWYVPVPFSFK